METDWTKHWEDNYGNFIWKMWVRRITSAYKTLLRNVNVNNPKILELGSGSGANSLAMAKILKAKDITLVDSNSHALDISKRLFKESNSDFHVMYVNSNILDVNLDERFDIVHSEGLIEHFYGEERVAVFKKHASFCKKGGFIIIFVPYKSFQYSLFKLLYRTFNRWIWDEEPFSQQELYALCKQHDLTIIKKYTSLRIHEIGILIKNS